MQEFDNFVKKNTVFLDNPYISGAITLFLIVYAGAVAPKLPEHIAKIFDNNFVKFAMFFLIIFISRKNATVALVATIALMVSIMTLHKIKFDKEMMEVVANKETKNHNIKINSCDCTCTDFEEIKPKTEDGKLIEAEIKNALNVGAISEKESENLVKSIIIAELQNNPVLIPKTSEGEQRMKEISSLLQSGLISSEEAKEKMAIIVVAEAISNQNDQNDFEDIPKIGQEQNNTNTLNEHEQLNYNNKNYYQEYKSEYQQEHQQELLQKMQPIQSIQFTQPAQEQNKVNNDLIKMAEEVQKRKEEEMQKTGTELSSNELRNLCVAVLNDFKKYKMTCDKNFGDVFNSKYGNQEIVGEIKLDQSIQSIQSNLPNQPVQLIQPNELNQLNSNSIEQKQINLNVAGVDPSESNYAPAGR